MSTAENKKSVQDAFAAWARGEGNAVFNLLADLPERAAFPCHRQRREVPFRMAGHMRRIEVCRSVAGVARKRRSAVAVGAAHDQRLMRPALIGLVRTVAGGMAVHAARMLQHLAGLLKQRNRAGLPIGNAGKVGGWAQVAGGGLRSWLCRRVPLRDRQGGSQ